jgi:HEAT repeat protein
MMEMLGKKSLTERSTAALTLAAIGTQEAREAIPVIEQYVREAPFVDLCRSLLQFDSKSTVAIQGLENIAKDPGPHAGDVPDAHYYLIRAGHNPEYHLQALIEGLESEGFGKLSSATHLGILGHLATKAIPFLQKTLKDDNPEVRVAAAHSILLISLKPTERKQAVDVIFNAVEEKVFMARLRAFSALEAFGSDESWAVPKLTALATNTTIRQERFRINAVKALGNIGSGAAESLPALRRLLKDDHWQVRKNAHEAIKKIESQPEKNILNN